MTSRIDRAFIRAFAKQRGEPTPTAESAEAAAPATSHVTRRMDVSDDTPAKPSGVVWQEMPASVSTVAASAETCGLADLGNLEVMSIGEVFPTELFDGNLTKTHDAGEKAAVVPALSPESVRRRLDEAEPAATHHLDLPEAEVEDVEAVEAGGEADVVVEDILSGETVDQALLDLDYFAPVEDDSDSDGEEQDDEAESEETPLLHIKGPFVPAWETDQIQWPRMAERLQTLDDRFETAGRQLAQAAREGLRTLAVTSTYRGEGRTTIAMNLARSAASAGIRVALVDGDVDNPALASSAGIAAAHGWHECLAGGLPLDEAAVASLGDGVTLLPLTSAVRRASVAAGGPAFASMIEALSVHFDLIVVDYGPLGEHPAPIVGDAAMLVRDIRCTSAEQALTAVRKIRELGPRSVGVVQNFT